MEMLNIEEIYKIDKDELLRYYDRIQNQFKNSGEVQIIARFLINQSIGNNYKDIYNVLFYFRNKLRDGNNLLDLAFEWIRAQKIRLEYKKYLIRAQYPNNNLNLAVDDCIFRFFLEYDKYIRKIFKKDTKEHNFSTLYEIFFSPYESKNIRIKDILEKYIDNVITHFEGMEKIDTSIIVLRSGLSDIIVKDYKNVLFARKEEKAKKEIILKKPPNEEYELETEFKGLLLERMIKTYCINKKEISEREIENAVAQFLSSYFKFGVIYEFDNFKELLIQRLTEDIYFALTESLKKKNKLENIKYLILNVITIFNKSIKVQKLDGLAWKKDLTPILKTFVLRFMKNLYD